jgi:hypothetical protein
MKLQFSLRFLLAFVLGWAAILALAIQFPQQTIFAAAIATMMLVPLVVSAGIFSLLKPVLCPRKAETVSDLTSRPAAAPRLLRSAGRFLGLWPEDHDPPLRFAILRAGVTTLVLIGFWPIIDWLAHQTQYTVITHAPIRQTRDRILQSSDILIRHGWPGVWIHVWKRELVQVSKWWLLLGGIAVSWSIVSRTVARRRLTSPQSGVFSCLLAFAPWLIVLEVGLLGAGILSWKLWFGYVWLKYLNFSLVVHAAIPLFLVGLAFFRSVLRLRWIASLIGAVCFVPLAEFVSLFLALFTERNPALL